MNRTSGLAGSAQAAVPSGVAVKNYALALLAAAALGPALFTPMPAMADYPNHLARMHLLFRHGEGQAHPFYDVAWAFYPNLAMDLIVPYAAKAFGVETAARLFLIVSQIMVLTGAAVLERAVKGRISLAPFAALVFLYSMPFAFGFLNFQFALGLALFGLAATIAARERPWVLRLGLHGLASAALFASHLFAFGVYGATLGLYELWRAADRRQRPLETAGRLAVLALPAIALFSAMMLAGGSVGGDGTRWFFGLKWLWPFAIVNGYSTSLSILCAVALGAFIAIAVRRKMLRLEGAGPWIAGGFALLYLVIPFRLFDTSFADLRLLPAAALILPAFASFSAPDRRWRLAAVSIVSVIALLNAGAVWTVWMSYRPEYKALIASFERIEKGSRVLVGHSGDAPDPPMRNLAEYPIYNAPTLAVHYADAFVPSFFTARGKQPIRVRTDIARLDVEYGGLAPAALLVAIAEGERRAAAAPVHIENWPRDYDYLYLVGPRRPNPAPDLLEEMGGASRFSLYRIRRQAAPAR